MATLIAKQGQSIYDVCLQAYASLNQLYKLIQDNGIPNINTGELQGTVFTYDPSLIANNSLSNRNRDENINYVTDELSPQALLDDDGNWLETDGGEGILID